MVIISKRFLNEFISQYPTSKEAILRWYLICKENNWENFSALKQVLSKTDYVGDNLYVFDIGGTKYRIIARIFFKKRTLFIRFIGTHAAYDQVKLSDL
jgi:mRNA interferase HigB